MSKTKLLSTILKLAFYVCIYFYLSFLVDGVCLKLEKLFHNARSLPIVDFSRTHLPRIKRVNCTTFVILIVIVSYFSFFSM